MEKDKKKKKSWFIWKRMGMTTQDNDDNDVNDDINLIERRWSNVDKTDDNSSFGRRQNDNSSLKRRRIDNSSLKRRLSTNVDKNDDETTLTSRLKKIASRVSKMFLSSFFPFAAI